MTDNIYTLIRERVLAALQAAVPDLPPELAARVEVTPTRDPAHGDMATNAALIAAKPARLPPAKIAAALAAALAQAPEIASAEPAGPGFVNLRLAPATLLAAIPAVLRAGEAFGASTTGHGKRINVEYVSANPTGPMHVGHCRGAVVGDALANLLAKAGYAVTKEFYVNDAGNQVAALAWASYWRYLESLGTALTEEEFAASVPGGLQYRGDYLVPVGVKLAEAYGASLAGPDLTVGDPASWLPVVRQFAIDAMLASIRIDLAELGVTFDRFSSERELLESGAPDASIAKLQADGLLYQGVLEPPKGKLPDDWEPREQLLFRSTQFGDDVDRPLRKSDGTNTYFANDIAYHAAKAARSDVLIDVLGADHGGYVSRMKAATKAITGGTVLLEVVLCQIVRVMKGGEPVRMSKRAGTFITLSDLLEFVGRDAVRFTMLTRKSDAQMDFDIDAAVAQTRENPVFYVQYAHARCRSVLRAAADMPGISIDPAASLDSLQDEAELAVVRRMMGWPRTVEAAAEAREPHRIAFFLYDLAADFHMLWNRGREATTLRFLQPDNLAYTQARVALVASVATVIRSGLQVMGVAPVEEMR
ncbi:arginine--tRNA ligase [Acidisphaera sp. L21]|uniref:arginine--tRNA ligase n=1 Tax=Acidisphaera sp. L21 TaxID=1641851 RepID=UPI00131DC2D4|nr:arginine--tRNA ligase [Acidisphaera sp. L21]